MPEPECPQRDFIELRNNVIDYELAAFSGSIEGISWLNTRVEWSEAIADIKKCEACGKMIVDLASGKFYCGLEVPAEVINSNAKILAS
ncbi:hypothetical protein KW803_01135 [Candidatus Saccharibacteria bacterium]|nr:hypothetical protein [Candidatus Saccharibacteria bacterium]